MSDRILLRQIGEWLTDLATLTAGAAPLADSKAKIAAMALMLAADYPSAAFSRQSLAEVARHCRFFPSYAELSDHLGAWWRDHRPTPPALSSPLADSWSQKVDAAHSQAASDWKDPAIVRAAVRSLDGHPWRRYLGGMLGGLVGRHAPDNMCLLPAEWHEQTPDYGASRLTETPKTRHLTPEQLATLKTPEPVA